MTFEKYLQQKRLELANSISTRKKVYLDTKFWLFLRDAFLSRTNDLQKIVFLNLTLNLVESKKCIFPISETVFIEIYKQTDKTTLEATIELIDQLSQGVSLLFAEERLKLELLAFVYEKLKLDTYQPNELVWTKLPFTLGQNLPEYPNLDLPTQHSIQKRLLDFIWLISLKQMYQKMPTLPSFFGDISIRLNTIKSLGAEQNKSFKQMFLSEIQGFIDGYEDMFEDLYNYLQEKNINLNLQSTGSRCENKIAGIVYDLFSSNKKFAKLPSISIMAGLHASIRWNSNRNFKPNDMPDFRHAVAALPYCDFFFTENSLKHLICQKQLSYDKLFRCKVISDVNEAVLSLSNIE